MVEFLTENWKMVTIAILIIDKIVALSPSKMDDLIWSSIKGFLYKVTGRK